METIICYDIDGVLNPFSTIHTLKNVTGWQEWKIFNVYRKENPEMFIHQNANIKDYTITFSKELLQEIESIGKETNVESQYLSTWGKFAHTIFAKRTRFSSSRKWVTTEEFTPKSIFSEDNLTLGDWWKHHYINQLANDNPDKQIVFIDDDILSPYDNGRSVVSKELVKHKPNLILIQTNIKHGLTKEHMVLIREITKRQNASSELIELT